MGTAGTEGCEAAEPEQGRITQTTAAPEGAEMSTINEIMGAVWRHGDDCIRDGDAASESFEALRELIAAALADARREGAEAMRAKAAQGWDGCMYNAPGETLDIGTDIRALPLPESTVEVVMDREHGGLTFAPAKREPVLLTDEQIERAVDGHGWTVSELQVEDIPGMARDIEAAVLAANNLGVRRG